MHTFRTSMQIFVTGNEGSGTTLMSRFLSEPSFAVSLTLNSATPGYRWHSLLLDLCTRAIWRLMPGELEAVSRTKQEGIWKRLNAAVISRIMVPNRITHIVWKRSFPFYNLSYFPRLEDVFMVGGETRIIVVNRDLKACAASVLRRGMEGSMKHAAERTRLARLWLKSELQKIDREKCLIVDYEEFISQPDNYTAAIETFAGYQPDTLNNFIGLIRKPTKKGAKIQKDHDQYLNKVLDSEALRLNLPESG